MKALAILALLFGLGGAASSVYAMAETKGNYDSMSREMNQTSGKSERLADLDRAVYRDYAQALGREVVGAWAGGLLALVLGAIAAAKGSKAVGIIAIIVGLAGAGMAFVVMPQPLVL